MQLDTPPTLLTLSPNTVLAVVQKETKNLIPSGQTTQGGSVCSLVNAHGSEVPQETIDISAIRDIDLVQGGEYVLF
jgi:hypothetical protein